MAVVVVQLPRQLLLLLVLAGAAATGRDFPRVFGESSVSVLRDRRDTAMDAKCHSFNVGDPSRNEFYSPNYPNSYPNRTDCVRVLEAEKGKLLKLDFRDLFDLEPSEDCRFDYLEVRDGQHGYARLIGTYCGKQFPPELTSKSRYLWLRFRSDENIEHRGFKAIWSTVERPTSQGVPAEPDSCMINVTHAETRISSKNITAEKMKAEKDGLPLDCMWAIIVKPGWRVRLAFAEFELDKPNECDANFVDIFENRTDIPSRLKNYCGSMADTVTSKSNSLYIRFYLEPRALNSSFSGLVTPYRDLRTGETSCADDEYNCGDTTCIDKDLKCNHNTNCHLPWDEEECDTGDSAGFVDSEQMVIILVVFSLIMFGMFFAFVFNCVRKLVRDHKIIQEHIRQSRENRLDEIGRKSTPCPASGGSRADAPHQQQQRRGSSESPSLEVAPSKELLPPNALTAHEYNREVIALSCEYEADDPGAGDPNDIHASNNASNATQERMQESSEEPEMRDNSCQTRESLFDPRDLQPLANPPQPLGLVSHAPSRSHSHAHSHGHSQPHSHSQSQPHSHSQSQPHSHSQSQPHSHSQSQSRSTTRCSECGSAALSCPRHGSLIGGLPPPPHGWSIHEAQYPVVSQYCIGQPMPMPMPMPEYPQHFQSPSGPTISHDFARHSPKYSRQSTFGSGTSVGSGSQVSSGASNPNPGSRLRSSRVHGTTRDPRYRAEAVIEVPEQPPPQHDRRPFSIESTKSAPDVIATH